MALLHPPTLHPCWAAVNRQHSSTWFQPVVRRWLCADRHLARRYGPPPSPAQTHRWHDCNHGRAEGSLRECAPRACARAPALRHLQQPSPACHKNILCNLYNHRKWNKSVLSPTPKNLKLWGLPCSRDLSSWAEHQQKPRTYTDNKRSAFLFLLHLSPF